MLRPSGFQCFCVVFDMNMKFLSYATYIYRMRQKNRVEITEISFDWEALAKRALKSELARAGVTYKVLSQRLKALGVHTNETAIANRISRGQFTFVFFLQCMKALEIVEIDLRDRTAA